MVNLAGPVETDGRPSFTVERRNPTRTAEDQDMVDRLEVSVGVPTSNIGCIAAEGFSASAFGSSSLAFAFPTTVGPFHYYDLHGALRQSLFDITAIRNLRSENSAAAAAGFEGRQAREEVVLAVAGVYLELMADIALLDRQKPKFL